MKKRRSRKTKTFFKTLKLLFVSATLLLTTVLLIGLWIVAQFPSEKDLKGCFTTRLYEVYLCPGSTEYARLQEISNYLEKSIVLTEDSSFWQHQGFDLEEIEKSLQKNLQTGKYSRGGSTITQQLAKNLFLTKDKTLFRKIKEAIITVRIEKTLKKKEILERYLNVVQFGKNLFGVKKAAQFYFKKSPKSLSIVESAFLTFLLPSPETYSLSFFKKELSPFASQRIHQIIDNLYRYQRISEYEYQAAQVEMLTFLQHSKFNSEDLPANLNLHEEDVSPEDDDL